MVHPGRVRRTSAETREHVLSVARELFYGQGVRATGVDTIAAAAGVAPTTLYRVFSDKDDLVGAYVEREAEAYRAWFDAALGDIGSAEERILALFEALVRQISEPACRGCPFQLALAELPVEGTPGREAAVRLKTWVHARLAGLVTQLCPPRDAATAAVLADQLMLVLEGVYASLLSSPATTPARSAVPLVRSLLSLPS